MWKRRRKRGTKPVGKAVSSKGGKPQVKTSDTTIVSNSCRLEGKIVTPGSLIIAGSITGEISCTNLDICKDGAIEATVEAENVNVGGHYEGDLTCNGRLAITSTGKVRGRISYGSLSIESGGIIIGTTSMAKDDDATVYPLYRQNTQPQQ
jgi:cytoskeletal protein CcmA (bactofilin family)